MGHHGAFNSNKILNTFRFNYIINRIGEKVNKSNSKKLKKNKTIVKGRYVRFQTNVC